MTTKKVVLVENEQMLGSLLGEWIMSQPGLELSASFTNGADFAGTSSLWSVDVDVMVLEIDLPDGDGINLAAQVCRDAGRHIPLVVLAGRPNPEDVNRLHGHFRGGWSIITKCANGPRQLASAIEAATNGMVTIDPLIRESSAVPAALAVLTDQERAILGSLAVGKSNQAIAEEHFLSVKSVERVISAVYDKLGVNNNTKLVNPRVAVVLKYLGL